MQGLITALADYPDMAVHFVHANGTPQVWRVDPKCRVTLDGRDVDYEDLALGDYVQMSGNPATSIVAARAALPPRSPHPPTDYAPPPPPPPPTSAAPVRLVSVDRTATPGKREQGQSQADMPATTRPPSAAPTYE